MKRAHLLFAIFPITSLPGTMIWAVRESVPTRSARQTPANSAAAQVGVMRCNISTITASRSTAPKVSMFKIFSTAIAARRPVSISSTTGSLTTHPQLSRRSAPVPQWIPAKAPNARSTPWAITRSTRVTPTSSFWMVTRICSMRS
jgi:hypothetical protein